MNSADIGNRQWTNKERQALRRASRLQAAGDDSRIDLEDIPRLSEAQLRSMLRLREVRKESGRKRAP